MVVFKEKMHHIIDGECAIWLIDLSKIYTEQYSILSAVEITKANQFIHKKERHRYLPCRYALRNLLGYYLQTPPASIHIQYSKDGKPYISNKHKHPYTFNISHSNDWACIAISLSHSVGIDIEEIKPYQPDMNDTAELFMSNTELDQLKKIESDGERAFIHCWTQKESILKQLGVGFYTDPKLIHTIISKDVCLRNYPTDSLFLNTYTLSSYILSLCTSQPVSPFFYKYDSFF